MTATATSPGRPRGDGGRFTSFDGVRGSMMILVFVSHVWTTSILPGSFVAVDLFFALSGYLITTLLVSEFRRDNTIWLGGFYGRRVLRLMPALIAAIVVTAVAAKLWHAALPVKREGAAALLYVTDITQPLHYTYGQVYGQTWSLAVEEQFYLVWPVTLLWALRRGLDPIKVALVGAAAMVAITVGFTLAGESRYELYRAPETHVPVIAAGVLLALYVDRRGAPLDASRWLRWASNATVVALVLVVALVNFEDRALYYGGWVLVAVGCGVIFAQLLAEPDGWLSRLLRTRWLVWFGQRSYAFYLWHFPIIRMVREETSNRWAVAVIAGSASLIATALSWRFIESRALEVSKRRFPRRRPNVAAPNVEPTRTPVDGATLR